MMSQDTTSSFRYSRYIGFSSDAFLKALLTSSTEVSLLRIHAKSTREASIVGTLTDIASNFPFNSGMTIPIAFAAPVVVGIME